VVQSKTRRREAKAKQAKHPERLQQPRENFLPTIWLAVLADAIFLAPAQNVSV